MRRRGIPVTPLSLRVLAFKSFAVQHFRRCRDETALDIIGSKGHHRVENIFVLYEFGDRLHSEVVGDIDDRGGNVLFVPVRVDIADQRAVDLDNVDPQRYQVGVV